MVECVSNMNGNGEWYLDLKREIKCDICMYDFHNTDIVDCNSCKMNFCSDCIKQHIKMNVFSKVGDVSEEQRKKIIKNKGNVSCPNPLCVGLFEKIDQKIHNVLSGKEELIKQWDYTLLWVRTLRHINTSTCETLDRISKALPDINSLEKTYKNLFPRAKMCGKCNYGPITKQNCDNLATHSHEAMNSCPICGHLEGDWKKLPNWNGKIYKEVHKPFSTLKQNSYSWIKDLGMIIIFKSSGGSFYHLYGHPSYLRLISINEIKLQDKRFIERYYSKKDEENENIFFPFLTRRKTDLLPVFQLKFSNKEYTSMKISDIIANSELVGQFKQGISIKILKTIHFDLRPRDSPKIRDIPKYIYYMVDNKEVKNKKTIYPENLIGVYSSPKISRIELGLKMKISRISGEKTLFNKDMIPIDKEKNIYINKGIASEFKKNDIKEFNFNALLSESGTINNLVYDKNGKAIIKRISLSNQWKDFISTANHAFGINNDIMGLNNLICRIDVVTINNGSSGNKYKLISEINSDTYFNLLNYIDPNYLIVCHTLSKEDHLKKLALYHRALRVRYYLDSEKILPRNATEEQIITAENKMKERNSFIASVEADKIEKKRKKFESDVRIVREMFKKDKNLFLLAKNNLKKDLVKFRKEQDAFSRKRKREEKDKKNVIDIIDSDDELLGEITPVPLDPGFFEDIEW
jgi:hypothetical protein